MAANKHRGEIEAVLDGIPHTLCLTLGALAELETAFGETDMVALTERFQSGRLSSRDVARIVGAGLRGGGNDVSDDIVTAMRADHGAAGFIAIVAELLAATFGGPAVGAAVGAVVGAATRSITDPPPLRASAEESLIDPFPGAR